MSTMLSAYPHTDDGRRWMRVTDHHSGDEWDEPARDWEHIIDLCRGKRHYRAKDGRIATCDD